MDAKILADAERYAKIKQYSLNYYHSNAEKISQQRKERYRAAHPDARPRGRPRKVIEA